jgi:DNA-binding XRE family transcriptional regulator
MARVTHVFGKRVAAARKELFMTQEKFGEAIGGVSDETISRIERLEVAGTLSKWLPKMAAVLGLPLDEFRTRFCVPESQPANTGAQIGIARSLPTGLDLKRLRSAQILPEYQIGVAASRRVDKISEHPDANRAVASPDRRAFTAPVDGDCQHPKWKHGEIVVFSFDAVEREGILSGRSYYLAFTDGSTTFKRLFTDESDPDVFILRCWNRKKFPTDQRVHRDEIVRIARAISKQVTVSETEE